MTITPFYGAAKGQSLQTIEYSNGTVVTAIIKTPQNLTLATEEPPFNITEYENPPLPSRYEQEFGTNIKSIHRTALRLIDLQETAKKRGQLTDEEEEIYQENMESLNLSAKNLAELQDREESRGLGFENREGLEAWFDRKKQTQKEKEKRNKESAEKKKKEEEEEKKRKEEEEEKKRKEEEKKEEEEEEEEEQGGGDDSITINLPPDDASVAEAKPVGLAIAGEGGVAASKPIATAVVGPAGLAIARPVATAIAGVAPDQALIPIYAQSYVSGTEPKNTVTRKPETNSEYLNRIISKFHQV